MAASDPTDPPRANAPEGSFLTGLLGDAEIEAALGEAALIRAMLTVEAALAESQAALGLIPPDPAARIAEAARGLSVAPADLAEATARDGVPVPGLVVALRDALDDEAAGFVHHGATSQDILDTARVLTLRDALDRMAGRLDRVADRLAGLADAHRTSVMPARTRGQQAGVTSFGLKAAGWLMPLVRERDALPALRGAALLVSLGGATGTQAALGPQARALEEKLADALDLGAAPMPWHTQREPLIALGDWAARLAGALGRMGGDVAALAQSEVAEVRLAGAGGSSTLPHKQNPVAAEAVETLALEAAEAVGALHRTAFARHERGGTAWMLEWRALPRVLTAAGAALARAEAMLAALEPVPARMRANLDAAGGLLFAEAATFALAEHMPRPEAQALVKAAAAEARESGRPLLDLLAERSTAPVDWTGLADPAAHLGRADAMIDRVLAAHARGPDETEAFRRETP